MRDLARKCEGKWQSILSALGIPSEFLKNAHGPCPICKGKDRYRWDNRNNRGGWICSHCGAGDGFDLLQKYHGWTPGESAKQVESVVGSAKEIAPPPDMTDETRRSMLRQVWRLTNRPTLLPTEPVGAYLHNRLGGRTHNFPVQDLRFGVVPIKWKRHEGRPLDNGEQCMVAIVRDPKGEPCTMHRTYIVDGKKADMSEPKRLMPGSYPEGSAVRLMPYTDKLGIAEGIETAFAAAFRFQLPVWATINAHNMERFIAPQPSEASSHFCRQ